MTQTRRVIPYLLAAAAWAHAPITPPLRGPLRTEGARIVDSTGATGVLRGAAVPSVEAATAMTLGVMRIRWNFNTVRIPLRAGDWQRESGGYLTRVSAAVTRAADADLIAVLVAEDVATPAFWAAVAGGLRDAPNAVFSVVPNSPGSGDTQVLFDAIRGAGARQIVSVPADATIRGENVMFEAAVSVGAKTLFAGLAGRVPVYAGEWGLGECGGLPTDPRAVSDLTFQLLYDFDDRGVSWTASGFGAGKLLRDMNDYEPTAFTNSWKCGEPALGQAILTWTTGDAIGFGYLRKEAIASVAGGPPTPLAPGQLVSLYIEQMGPAPAQSGTLDASSRLPLQLGGTEVYFDGQRVPILFAGQYQINVHVPPALIAGRQTLVQVVFRGVPSNRVLVDVVAAAPELFYDPLTRNALALNENGTRNSGTNPAAAGSIVVLFATGTGPATPVGVAGQPAPSPHPLVREACSVSVEGQEAEVLFAGEVPGFIGLSQINARLPRDLKAGSAAVTLRVAARESQVPVVLSVR